MHRLNNVLDLLCSEVLVAERQLALDLIVHDAGDADAAGVGETLQSRGDVDAIAVDLLALDHHVAEIDANAEFHPARRLQIRILALERRLNLDRAIHRLDHAGEVSQHAVASGVHEAPAMILDATVYDLAADRVRS